MRSRSFPIGAMLLPAVLLGVVPAAGRAQERPTQLLLPGDEYHEADLPAEPAGTWWTLVRRGDGALLERADVTVTAIAGCGDAESGELTGRSVAVAGAEPILMVRGGIALSRGPVHTVVPDARDAERVEAQWNGRALVLYRTTSSPVDDQPGAYEVYVTFGERTLLLHTDQWHGDGHWLVRWIGDLNRDGWPDALFDASYKYSVRTTRLFLSRVSDGAFELLPAATFSHSAC